MPRGQAAGTWTSERRHAHSEAIKARWAQKKAQGPVPRRIVVRSTVHIFKECLATLEVLQRRFLAIAEQVHILGADEAFAKCSSEAINDSITIQLAIDALQDVVALKEAIELPPAAAASDPHVASTGKLTTRD